MEVFSLKPDSKVVKRRLAIFGLHSDFIQLEDHCFRASNSVGKGDVLFESLTESAFGVEILTLCLFTPSNRFNASSDAPSNCLFALPAYMAKKNMSICGQDCAYVNTDLFSVH
ncbi:hypothetical protein M514_18143 [Trichuris suis]|uniref:Uncharacterized protein n=1 Tax=Trichuris suis TaxID=68888 RepID=A0A085NJW2_9BILA|nr:hypothetical protein M514_18143 [Trichuris suis]